MLSSAYSQSNARSLRRKEANIHQAIIIAEYVCLKKKKKKKKEGKKEKRKEKNQQKTCKKMNIYKEHPICLKYF